MAGESRVASRRVGLPPSSLSGDMGVYLGQVANALNALPRLSHTSYDDPNSNVTGGRGDLAVNIASADVPRLWQHITDSGTTGWVAFLYGGTSTATSSTSFAITAADTLVLCDASASRVTAYLGILGAGAQVSVVKTDATANPVTIVGRGTTISTEASQALTAQAEALTMRSTGTVWWAV